MKKSRARLLVAVLSLLLFAPQTARSSCNSMPDAGPGGPPGDSSSKPLGYKGALGRIDRAFYVAGTSRSIVVMPDETCVAQPAPPVGSLSVKDKPSDLVALLVLASADGSRTSVRVWADEEVCKSVPEQAGGAAASPAAEKDARAIQFMKTCSLEGMELVSTEKKLESAGLHDAVKLTLPSLEELQAVVVVPG